MAQGIEALGLAADAGNETSLITVLDRAASRFGIRVRTITIAGTVSPATSLTAERVADAFIAMHREPPDASYTERVLRRCDSTVVLIFAITSRRRAASIRDQKFYASADRDVRMGMALQGQLLAAFRRTDGRGYIMLLDTPTLAQARQLIESYPSVATEVTRFELIVVHQTAV